MSDNATIPYKQAIAELEQILATLQGDSCDIDSMVTLTKRATELINICRNRLTTTETELKTVLESLQSDNQ